MVSPFDVIAFLDSLAPAYGGGIPRGGGASVPAGGARVSAVGPVDGALVVVGRGGGAPLHTGTTGALLRAAIEKGLKLEFAGVRVVTVAEGATAEELSAALQGVSASVGIALGDGVARLLGLNGAVGTWNEGTGRAWRITLDLGAVVDDPGLKRPLWTDLQAVGLRLTGAEVPR